MRKDKKDDELSGGNPYAHLDKTVVVQEARAFNETPINARKCTQTLCKLIYLFQHGEVINRNEATDTFFATTKLWQSKDPVVRRLVYLAIKELCFMADDVIIVTSSLMKDMTGKEDLYRAAAIRALCRILDGSMLQTIDRYMKQAIVDRVPSVASAALVSSLHMMKKNPDVVKRWANEIQEAVTHDNHMVQFHALGLLYHIRSSDKLAVNKLVQKFSKSSLRSPHALCYLIRIAAKLIEDDDATDRAPFSFIESCLRHKSEMVTYEAASAIVRLPNITSGELASAINCLQHFCSSPKPALRFAAVRTLNKISINYPQAVTSCNVDLEQLITDQNRSIATLAITTLLKTGAEASIERLMKQISSFVSEISDEFKIVVIEAIRSLCLRYPRKHVTMMNFLATMLRGEGGYDYKKSIVDTIITIIEENVDAKEIGLSHLCEFIEDCEHTTLATRVLFLLGREGPITANPQRYIRFIYNRVILEANQVRAAAVTALAKFGHACADLRKNVIVLLKRSMYDTDDDVRDRATFYLNALESEDSLACSKYITDALRVSLVGLEKTSEQYVKGGDFNKPFDLKQVPLASQPITVSESKQSALSVETPVKKEEKNKLSRQEMFAQQLSSIAGFSNYGPLFKSSQPVVLSEAVSEYNVTLVKHIYENHVVLQFDCKNTVQDQRLTELSVELTPTEEVEWELDEIIELPVLAYNETGTTYLSYNNAVNPSSFQAMLKFKVFDVDPTTGEPDSDESYDDSYALEDVEVVLGDFINKFSKPDFNVVWETAENEVEETYGLDTESLAEAINNFLEFLSMSPCNGTDKVPDGKSSHVLLLSGLYRDGSELYSKVKFVMDPSDGTLSMHIIVRGTNVDVNTLIANSIS